MNKKVLFPLLVLFLLFTIIFFGISRYRSSKPVITETIPLIPKTTTTREARPAAEITSMPGIPKQTNIISATKTVSNEISMNEKQKFFDSLPIRRTNFATSVKILTTINIYSFIYDPDSVLRIEIYGINYNLPDITGPNAIAFKESFLDAKKQITLRGGNVKNLQIIYGNRQYIQDTATYWVNTFKLLD